MTRRRLDVELVRRGLTQTMSEAREAILSGKVTVGGGPVTKPGSLVASRESVAVRWPARNYVSRGGEKLAAALDRFGIDVSGRRCLDAGASTGGFTHLLLDRGAEHVVAVDVGYGQLAWELRNDPRVTVKERTNVRSLRPEDLPFPPDLVVADLSFISLTKVMGTLSNAAAPRAMFVLLVKPQFESPREQVERGGVVRDRAAWEQSVSAVAAACREAGLGPRDVAPSPVLGPAGNVEFFLYAQRSVQATPLVIERALDEGTALLGAGAAAAGGEAV